MAQIAFVQSSFLGGEVSASMQGRIDRPDYRTFMNVCLNMIPVETGAAQRRPGTRLRAPARGGASGKLISFAFKQELPYDIELTDGYLRFFTGRSQVMTNDAQTVSSVSSASPAVVTTQSAHGWSSGNAGVFQNLSGATKLQNRALTITVTGSTTFTIADAITGDPIDGSDIGDTFSSGTFARVLEIATPYDQGSWSNVRSVQAETSAVLLNGTVPQVLTVESEPTDTAFATFSLADADFIDGPYLDAIGGSFVTPSATTGIVTLTFTFQAYSASVAYSVGDYVISGGIHYRSIAANNVGNTPALSLTKWLAVNAGDPINAGTGFTAADIGRHIRLHSQPPLYNAGDAYTTGQVVSYTDGNLGTNYWKANGSISAGVQPGTSSSWLALAAGALWSWGRIVSVDASGLAAPNSAFGNMTQGAGVNGAFDGTTTKSFLSATTTQGTVTTYATWSPILWSVGNIVQYNGIAYVCTQAISGFVNVFPPPDLPLYWAALGAMSNLTINGYCGGNFTSAKAVQAVTVYPTADLGFTGASAFTLTLRASHGTPSFGSGTVLGTTGSRANTFSPITINSGDTTTLWEHVWVELTSTFVQPLPDNLASNTFLGYISLAQILIYEPNVANGSVITVQIVGEELLYTSTIREWRLGAYGGTNGYPKCGTYHEGRLWLSGVIGNRVDGSKSNVLQNDRLVLDFAPTAPSGAVADDNAIAAIFTAKDVNTILWMESDEQGIICGTQAGEWLVAPTGQGALTPTTTSARRRTKIGCADIEPRRTEHTLVFVQRYGRKLMEYFGDVFAGKFSAPNLSEKAKHMTVGGIAEIAYQQELAPILWARRNDGVLIGATYKRDSLLSAQGPTFVGWHRHAHGADRVIESISVAPSAGGSTDSLAMMTNDPVTNVRFNEVLTDLLDEGFSLPSCWFVDSGIEPTSVSLAVSDDDMPFGGLTVNGLWPHNGKEVTAFVAGLDCGEHTVSEGSITIPFGDGVSEGTANGLFTRTFVEGLSPGLVASEMSMAVGFAFTSDGQIVRPALPQDAGTQAGPALGKERRIHRFAAQVYGCINGKIKFGVDFDHLRAARLTNKRNEPYTAQQLWSGIYRDQPEAESDFDNMLCWRVERPLPAFVVALGGTVQTQDG